MIYKSFGWYQVHDLVNSIEQDLAEVLPAIHALTGCDTTSKFGTKGMAFKEGKKNGYNLLYSFGRDEISNQMTADAEKFLLNCIKRHDVSTFDELRYIVYHEKHLQFDIERFPPTSASVATCSIPREYSTEPTGLWVHIR